MHPFPDMEIDDNMVPLTEAGHVRKLRQVEDDLIRYAVARYAGRSTEIAFRLGISRSTLYRKLNELGIDPKEWR